MGEKNHAGFIHQIMAGLAIEREEMSSKVSDIWTKPPASVLHPSGLQFFLDSKNAICLVARHVA